LSTTGDRKARESLFEAWVMDVLERIERAASQQRPPEVDASDPWRTDRN
jgi:hypothetical protein